MLRSVHLIVCGAYQALETYKAGLALDKDNEECKDGLQRTIEKISQSQGGEMDQERAAKAMADPEIQAIMMDPIVRQTLSDMSTDPRAAQKAMADPYMAAKISKLIAAGVVQTR